MPQSTRSHKPLVFLSHIHEDQDCARLLEQELTAALLGAIEFFNSSNHESLKLGDPWRDRVIERLGAASALLVILTPKSVGRPWVNFESGGGWVAGARVVPCCAKGMTIDQLPAPYSHLQSVDLTSPEGLQQLVRIIADLADLRVPDNFNYTDAATHISLITQRVPDGKAISHNVPDTYVAIADVMSTLALSEAGGWPSTMMAAIENKAIVARALLDYVADRLQGGGSVFFGMSTTCHLIFEYLVRANWYSEFRHTIHTSYLPILLSAQIQRVPCSVYGSRLVHEFASFALSERQLLTAGVESDTFDHVFIGARAVTQVGDSIQIRTCKEDHTQILRRMVAGARKTLVVLFDSSKLESADGTTFLSIDGVLDVNPQLGARTIIATDSSRAADPIGRIKLRTFREAMNRAHFTESSPDEQLIVWTRDSPWTDRLDTRAPRGYAPLPRGLVGTKCQQCGETRLTGALITETADESDPNILCLNCGFWRD